MFILLIVVMFLMKGRPTETSPELDPNRAPSPTSIEVENIPEPTSPPNPTEDYTPPRDFDKEIEEYQVTNAPDVYLSNKTPHETELFRITSELVDEGEGYFAFTVTILGEQEKSRQSLFDWIISTGLTQAQIETLVITF